MKNVEKVVMKNGRPASRGVCAKCGTKMFKIGDGPTLTGGALKAAKKAVSKKKASKRKSKKASKKTSKRKSKKASKRKSKRRA